MIVSRSDGVTLVGGGDLSARTLERALALAPHLVAADGGAAQAMALGHVPEATLGDLDSLDEQARAKLPAGSLRHIPEQDSTDFGKCLTHVTAPFLIAVGFLGRRMDHSLAVLSALVQHQGAPVIVLGEHDVVCHLPRRFQITRPLGSRFSLFPMAEVTGTSEGLRWPIDGLTLAPMGQIGTSNEVSDPKVTLEIDGPGLLALLPPEALEDMRQALGI